MPSSKSFEELFEEVKDFYDIVEVVSSYVKLKKVGRNYVGLCPFHSEKTPSFTVSPEKQIFKCFGCGAGGDVITFYMKIKGLSFKEALFELAEKAGIEVDPKEFKKRKIDKSLVEINYKVAKYYHHLLFSHSEAERARQYLQNRGLSEDTIKKFMIGFAPSEGRVLAGYLRASLENIQKVDELGIVKKSTDGSYLDLFRERIIFPIFNLKGECVGFGGRALSPEVEPKYLNTPDSPVYKKSEVLYGLFQAKDFIKKENKAYLVEGYFDFLSLWEKGIKNITATCGTALTERHVKVLKKFSENWTILYDGDQAGKKAAVRAISLFLKDGLLPKCIVLPSEEDPDSFARKFASPEILKEELGKREKSAIEFVINFYEPIFSESPLKAYREVLEVFSVVEDPFLKREIVKELSFALDIPEDEIRRGFLQLKRGEKQKIKASSLEGDQKGREEESLKIIAQFIYNHPEYLEKLEKNGLIDLLKLKESCYSNFVQLLIQKIKEGKLDLQYLPDPQFQEFLSELVFSPPFENPEEVFLHLKNYIRNNLKRLEVKKILENLKFFEKLGKKEEVERCLLLLKNSLSFQGR